MNFFEKVRTKFPEALEIPDQTLPGDAIIEIYGNRRVLIDGHCRVLQYGCECIWLRNDNRIVRICGSGLCVVELSGSRAVITGCISGVSFGDR